MAVVAGRARFNLATLPRDDFPVIAEGELPTHFRLPAAMLKQIIDKTRFAISSEETRYYLNGIFLHVSEEAGQPVLKAAATRSEEHTSELKSLMRTSYAVFCL